MEAFGSQAVNILDRCGDSALANAITYGEYNEKMHQYRYQI